MIKTIRIFLWQIAAELEYHLYPWKDDSKPPEEIIRKYNLSETPFNENLHYDWLKSHDDKINRLQDEIIYVQQQIINLKYSNEKESKKL